MFMVCKLVNRKPKCSTYRKKKENYGEEQTKATQRIRELFEFEMKNRMGREYTKLSKDEQTEVSTG